MSSNRSNPTQTEQHHQSTNKRHTAQADGEQQRPNKKTKTHIETIEQLQVYNEPTSEEQVQPEQQEEETEQFTPSSSAPAHRNSQDKYMQAAYQVDRVSTHNSAAVAVTSKPSSRVGEVGVPFYIDAPLTPTQLSFVNHGLHRWLKVRENWVTGNGTVQRRKTKLDKPTIHTTSSNTAPSSSSSAGKTQLPHPMSINSLANHHSDDDDDDDDGEFVVDGSDSDEIDINEDVPRIIRAREEGTILDPRVKLSHMVDILVACWVRYEIQPS